MIIGRSRKALARAPLLFLLLGISFGARAQAPLEGSAPKIMEGLSKAWSRGFNARHPGTKVSVSPPFGPPQGALSPRLEAFLDGHLDFAFLSRRLADADVATFRRSHGYDPLVIPVGSGSWNSFGFVDPVVVIVNSHNRVSGLTFSELDAMFSKTRKRGHRPIRTWLEVQGGLQDRPIHVVGGASWMKMEDSARGGVFRERVLLGGEWQDDPRSMAGGEESEVPARVASDPDAIGFTGLGHLVPGTRAVPIASNDIGPFIAPTFEAVAHGRYSLARTIDLVVARKPGSCLPPRILSFIRYVLGREGQRAIKKEGHFLELTRAQARNSWLRALSCS